MADLAVADAVDGAVGPFGGHGGEGLGIGVAGRGVVGQQHEGIAVAAVHLEFAEVEEDFVAAPAPLDEDVVAG